LLALCSSLDDGGWADRSRHVTDPDRQPAWKKSTEQLRDDIALVHREIAAHTGRLIELLGELGRRDGFRDDGATSLETWAAEYCGVSLPTARVWSHVAERLDDLPQLAQALSRGDLTFDKVRAVVDTATPETDEEYCETARSSSVRELADLARTSKDAKQKQDGGRNARTLRCNDSLRTITAQLTPENYAEVKTLLANTAKRLECDRDTRWDQRLHDALLILLRRVARGGRNDRSGAGVSENPFFVVAHVPLSKLISDSGDISDFACELEAGGYVHCDVIRRLACDSTFAIGIDDDVGRTMFEGRARRWATPTQRREVLRRDRHCRFPGCVNAMFTNVHHVTLWSAGGTTDIDNLVMLCEHHHHLVHSSGWSVSGNANDELRFVGPNGHVSNSRPSRLWTVVTGQSGSLPHT
jgi:hypothetical protein